MVERTVSGVVVWVKDGIGKRRRERCQKVRFGALSDTQATSTGGDTRIDAVSRLNGPQ